MLKINLMDMEVAVEEGTKIIDIINKYEQGDKQNIIACKYNNDIKTLNHEIDQDGTITYVTTNSSNGMRIYVRALSLILIKAFEELYPNAKLTIKYSLGEALCYEITGMEVIDEVVVAIREKMKEIISANIPIERKILSKSQVKQMYLQDGYNHKIDILNGNVMSHVLLYYCEDTYGYFYGEMPISTGYIKMFDVKKYEKDILLMYPDKNDLTKIKASHENKKLYKTLEEYEQFFRTVKISNISELNDAVKRGKIGDVIRVSEAKHEKKIANIADTVTNDKNKKIVLIAGPSSSGKTTFAQRLGIQLRVNGINPITLSVDNYFVDRDQTPKDENGEYDFECLEAIDLELFNKHLIQLLNGEAVEIPTFNFHKGVKEFNGNIVKMNHDDILVIEGIHALNNKLTEQVPASAKFKIFISALTVLNIDEANRISTTDTRLIRRIIRDNQCRSYPIADTIARWPSVRKGEDKYIFPYQEEADVMFNSSLPYEFSVFRTFAEPLLLTVDEKCENYSEAKRLYELLNFFLPIETKEIPINSIIREFTGDGCFYR